MHNTISYQGMMALAGVSYGNLVVSSYSIAHNRILQLGFADDINTYVMISGSEIKRLFYRAQYFIEYSEFASEDLIYWNTFIIIGIWLSAFSFGNFIGPTIGGALVQTGGFREATVIFFVLYLTMIMMNCFEGLSRKTQEIP